MRIIDFHSHLFSRPFFEALAAQSPQEGGVEAKLAHLASRTGIELPSPDLAAHVARWIAELDGHGVEHLVSFASLPEEILTLAEAASLAKGRLTPFALVNPKAGPSPEQVQTLLAERGFGGVLLFPAMHHFHIGGEESTRLLEVLDAAAATVFVHCGLLVVKLRDLLGFPRMQNLDYANPLGIIPAANAFPRIHFVIPHFGAGFFRETLMAGAQCENVFVDSSSSNSWIATQPKKLTLASVFERALEVFGAERILFGTDSGVFPTGWRDDRLREQREALEACGAGKEEMEKIFAGNAERLLKGRRQS